MDIIERKDNPLLNREEAVVKIRHEGKSTPSRNDILALCVKELKASKDLIIVDRIITRRGQNLTEARILVYKKKEEIPEGKVKKMEKVSKASKGKPAEKPEEANETKDDKAGEPSPESPKEKSEKPEAKPENESPKEEPPEAEAEKK